MREESDDSVPVLVAILKDTGADDSELVLVACLRATGAKDTTAKVFLKTVQFRLLKLGKMDCRFLVTYTFQNARG